MRFVARGRPRCAALLLVAPLALAAACQSASGAPVGPPATSNGTGAAAADGGAAGPAAAGPAAITISPADKAAAVDPSSPVTVSVSGGKLTAVTMTSGSGSSVSGTLSPDGSRWTAAENLNVSTTYTVTAQATSSSGQNLSRTATFTTLTPKQTIRISSVTPSSGSTVGVGQPVSITFRSPITTAAGRAAVERNLHVTTTPAVTGSWHWFGNDRVDWRPQAYWAPGTKVSVRASLNGVKVADGVYGVSNQNVSFTIGRSLIATADVASHHMTVVENGKTVATYPITAGQPGLDTWNGVMVVMEKDPSVEMNSETVGLGSAYDIPDVHWAIRLTTSGTFVHDAPWSVASQGHANVSHGCIGMSDTNSKAFYDLVIPGDIVQVVNSKETVQPDNGFGDWNLSWAQWTAGSALSS